MRHYDNQIWDIAVQAVDKWLDDEHENSFPETLDDKSINSLADQLAVGKEVDPGDGQVNSHFFLQVARHLYLKQAMSGVSYQRAYEALYRIWYHIGNVYVFPVTQMVIMTLLDYGNSCTDKVDFMKMDRDLQRMIKAGKYLEKKFGRIPVKNGGFDHSELDGKVFSYLDRNVNIVGGVIFWEYLVNTYLIPYGNYVEKLDRYMMIRQDEKTGNFPLQLLLNLAGKHLERNVRRDKTYNEMYTVPVMKETVEIAKAYLDVCGLHSKSEFEYAMMAREDCIYYVLDELIYEKMCLPMQYSCRYVVGALTHLIAPFWDSLNKKYRFRDYCKFVEASYRAIRGAFTVRQIAKASGLPMYKTEAILADVSVPSGRINRDYTDLISEANFLTTPLVRMPNGKYMLVDANFTGIGYYLIMQKQLDDAGIAGLRFTQGHNLERWLQDEMTKYGIEYKTGAYPAKHGCAEGECDIVLEHNGLYFMELKKQSIMQEFNRIDDVSLYGTLGKGMVHAQAQAFRHELYWLANQGIELSDGSSVKYDADSPVYKISVCFSDYDFLSSKAFSRMLMDVMFTGEFIAFDASRQGELRKLNKYAAALKENVRRQNALLGRETADIEDLISPVMFCSLQQVLTAIWCMGDAEGFYDVLKEWICRADANLDLYLLILVRMYEKEHPGDRNRVSKVLVEKAFEYKSPRTVIS